MLNSNMLTESMYDYRSEREVEESLECKVCNIEITEQEHSDQAEMCDFCYNYEPTCSCNNCSEGISQNLVDNFNSLCNDCEQEEKQSD